MSLVSVVLLHPVQFHIATCKLLQCLVSDRHVWLDCKERSLIFYNIKGPGLCSDSDRVSQVTKLNYSWMTGKNKLCAGLDLNFCYQWAFSYWLLATNFFFIKQWQKRAISWNIFNLQAFQPTSSKEPENTFHGKCLVTNWELWTFYILHAKLMS